MTAYLALICLRNFLKERDLQNGDLLIVMLPMILRLFRIK